MSVVAMGVIAAGSALFSHITKKNAERTAAKEDTKALSYQYAESVREQKERNNLFNTTMGRTYGADFLSNLQAGKSVEELMGSIGSNTALGKQLAMYAENANLAVSNANQQNAEAGVIANMQGQQYLNEMLAQQISAQMGSGEAAASQATSGIRSDRGTGDNALEMQTMQNKLNQQALEQKISMQNKQTIIGLAQNQRSASQQAQQLRKQMEISGTEAVENALNALDEHRVDMRDKDETQKQLALEATDRNTDAGVKGFSGDEFNEMFAPDDLKFIDD